jgi:gliding motility-associated-like protein
MYFLLVMLFFAALPSSSHALSMHCASVGAFGDVTISWDRNSTPTVDFRSWHVYHSSAAPGPYTLIDSLLINTDTTDIHPTANAANSAAYYFVIFKSNNGSPDIYSDTIRAIGLNINNPGNGYANLSWNAMHVPLPAANNPYYYIHKEYPPGIFTLLDSIDARTAPNPMTFTDSLSVCDDTVKYWIEVKDSSGCTSISAVKKDRFKDIQVPFIPFLDSVSVDASGQATVSWLVSNSGDTKSYVILQNPGLISVDTVIGHFSTFLATSVLATGASQNFVLLAIDGCGNRSATSTAHSTIYLSNSFNLCQKSVSLSWSPYNFWGSPPLYGIYRSINGGPEVLIDTTQNTQYTDTNLISGSNFCFRIKALEKGGIRTTSSNTSCLVPVFPPPPSFSYIRKVTVVATDQVLIEAYVDAAASVSSYQLLRSNSQAGPFSLIASQSISGVSTVTFTDNVNTNEGPYYYAVVTYDSCGRSVITSQISNTILVTGESVSGNSNTLEWTDYASWPNGVDRFNIYRSNGGNVSGLPIATVSANTFSFMESIINNYSSGGEFCYIVEAVEAPGNPNLFTDSSRSNEVCIKQQPVIFVPNAFNPGGPYNPVFYPSNAYVPADSYSLDIFNRWGEVIFHTNNPQEGWDGTSNGEFSPQGVYVYRIRSKNPDNSDLEKVGGLTLIR